MRRRLCLIPLLLSTLTLAFVLAACGDYRPCDVLAQRICSECPNVSDEWVAACMCIEYDTLKENGYKCADPSDQDKVRCHATLENWDESLCEELN